MTVINHVLATYEQHMFLGCRFLKDILGGGVPPGPENPYPISDQNIRFSVPYFRPDSQNVALFQTL